MVLYQTQFLERAVAQAKSSGHIFPEMAACEAALESRYGTSSLAIADNNLFGLKAAKHPTQGTASLPTKEDLDGKWVRVQALWNKYTTLSMCFTDRMVTLRRLAPVYPHYKAALEAKDPITYVTEVSKTWSTDPNRAKNVIAIYNQIFASATPTANAISTPAAHS